MALSAKQERFVQEYLVDLNASAAILRAGYQSKNPDVDGYKLLVSPSIAILVEKAMEERSKRTGITAEYVLNGIRDIADRQGIKENDTLKAFELLGKHLKLFTEKIEQSGETTVNNKVDLSHLTTDEIRELIKGGH
jgi:phage terminase small subunit